MNSLFCAKSSWINKQETVIRQIEASQCHIKHKFITTWLCRSVPALPCQWCVWWAAPTQQRPLLDTGPPACTGDCWPDCRRPSPGPASHPSCCRRHTTQNTNTSQSVYSDKTSCFLIYCQLLRYREFHLHTHFHLKSPQNMMNKHFK